MNFKRSPYRSLMFKVKDKFNSERGKYSHGDLINRELPIEATRVTACAVPQSRTERENF